MYYMKHNIEYVPRRYHHKENDDGENRIKQLTEASESRGMHNLVRPLSEEKAEIMKNLLRQLYKKFEKGY